MRTGIEAAAQLPGILLITLARSDAESPVMQFELKQPNTLFDIVPLGATSIPLEA